MKKLANGVEMPLIGLGTFQLREGKEAEDAVRWALEAGYRHIDTAQDYGNEASVGKAIRGSGVPTEQVFVSTKFFPGSRDPVEEAKRSLQRFGIDRIDLYLVHWPQGGPTWAWRGMERALEQGLVRAIGVSNFGADELAAVIDAGDVPPTLNQVQFSPFKFRRALLAVCEQHRIALEAYSPLTRGEDLAEPVIDELARRNRRTPAQVLLRWAVQRQIPTIPKSIHRERIVENLQVFDFHLSQKEMTRLDALDRTNGTGEAIEREWWRLRWRVVNRAGRILSPRRRRQQPA